MGIQADTRTNRTYSEIVWLGAGWIVPTRVNANRITGLPNSYDEPDCPEMGVEPDDQAA